jgi:hypothetical protein
VVRARLPRAALLLALGYALRWPGWGVPLLRAGDGAVWAHFLAFDALHAIAVASLAGACVLALPSGPRGRGAALAALTALAVLAGVEPLQAGDPGSLPASIPLLALAQAAGGTSAFPLFPWVGYFFAGALVGVARADGRGALAAAACGAALVAGACLGGADMPPGDPRLFALRLGVVLVSLSALSAAPATLAARVRFVGRASLGVYVLHLPVVYGWSTHQGLAQRVGPRLGLAEALAIAVAVLAGALAASHAFGQASRRTIRAARWIAERSSSPLPWRGPGAGGTNGW